MSKLLAFQFVVLTVTCKCLGAEVELPELRRLMRNAMIRGSCWTGPFMPEKALLSVTSPRRTRFPGILTKGLEAPYLSCAAYRKFDSVY